MKRNMKKVLLLMMCLLFTCAVGFSTSTPVSASTNPIKVTGTIHERQASITIKNISSETVKIDMNSIKVYLSGGSVVSVSNGPMFNTITLKPGKSYSFSLNERKRVNKVKLNYDLTRDGDTVTYTKSVGK